MAETTVTPQLLDTHQAAAFLGYHPEYVRRLARQGKIPAVRVRREWRFYLAALQEWIAQGCPHRVEQPNLFQ